jgi:hypothetical protein
LTATSADGVEQEGWFVAAVGLAEGSTKKVDGVALEAESDVDSGGDAAVGVTQELLDHDEFDALLQEEGRGPVPEVVETDRADPGEVGCLSAG